MLKQLMYTPMKLLRRAKRFYKVNIQRDLFSIAINQWFADKGDMTLRLNYPLTDKSIVFDVGGHEGVWSEAIFKKYKPYIYVFEPVPESFALIEGKFNGNPKIFPFQFGLLDTSKNLEISLHGTGSSLYKNDGEYTKIAVVDIHEFLENSNITEIDLIKINIEGAEYPLLKRMIEKRIVQRCKDIQIQFHNFYPNAVELRSEIRAVLAETHFLTYDYPFVWENWRRVS